MHTGVPRSRAASAGVAAQDARDEHPHQPQPPVDHRLVDRQRAAARAPARSQATLHPRRRPRSRTRWTRRAPSAWPSPATRSAGCQAGYAPLDVLGINEYFGWYPGPGGTIADQDLLSATSTRCAPATRTRRSSSPRPAPRPTATARPRRRARTRSSRTSSTTTSASTRRSRGCRGAIWWALQEFRVRPSWDGGNPRPSPPIHQKGLITQDGAAQARVLRPPADLQGHAAARQLERRRRRCADALPSCRRMAKARSHNAERRAAASPRTRAPRAACAARAACPASSTASAAIRSRFSVDARELRLALAGSGAVLERRARRHDHLGRAQGLPAPPGARRVMHVDLLRVDLNKPIEASVAAAPLGVEESPGVKEGGILEQVTREITVEALPNDIPEEIVLDVSAHGDARHRARCRPVTAPAERHLHGRPRGDRRRLRPRRRGSKRSPRRSRRRPRWSARTASRGRGRRGRRGRGRRGRVLVRRRRLRRASSRL